ncbi:MAG: PrsW family glutamic-type intramembrane protease [Bacteroidota bacterium]
MTIFKSLISLIPVFLFLLMMISLDSFKLVRKKLILFCLAWGLLSAGLSYFFNTYLNEYLHFGIEKYSNFVAPILEEALKFALLWFLIRKNKVGFMIDGAIYGFAIGAAFSFVENLYYLFLFNSEGGSLLIWIIRGFGTAIMHGGATAIMGIVCMSALNRQSHLVVATFLGGISAIILHSCYNQLLAFPLLAAAFIIFITPVLITTIFMMNEISIRNWLELEFNSEVNMLIMIKKGMFSQTKTGSYLVSIRTYFPAEVVVDMYCYISLYLELSMKAKSLLMLKEVGLSVPQDPGISSKLLELNALRKAIGLAGYLAISPVLKMTPKDLWKLSLLDHQ